MVGSFRGSSKGLTHERLLAVVSYDDETGLFTWSMARSKNTAGRVLDHVAGSGYRRITIDGKQYAAARLVWFYKTGEWPKHQIDHIDRDRTNDRFSNLRLATPAQNGANKKLSRNNRSGFKGVSFSKKKTPRPWRAYVGHNYIGSFATPEEASEAYLRTARILYGEFASTS